jgi:hypothetical protein
MDESSLKNRQHYKKKSDGQVEDNQEYIKITRSSGKIKRKME